MGQCNTFVDTELKLCLLNVAQLLLNICPRSLLTMKCENSSVQIIAHCRRPVLYNTVSSVSRSDNVKNIGRHASGCQGKVNPGVFTHKLLFSLHHIQILSPGLTILSMPTNQRPFEVFLANKIPSLTPTFNLNDCKLHQVNPQAICLAQKCAFEARIPLQISNIRDQIYVGH